MNRTLAQELANIMINYETITKFIAEKISDKMNESEKAIYVKLIDEYEILIFNRLKNFVENFSADNMGGWKNAKTGSKINRGNEVL